MPSGCQGRFGHGPYSRFRKVDLEHILKGQISTREQAHTEDLRRGVDFRFRKTSGGDVICLFLGCNDRFSEAYRRVCRDQPNAHRNG
jgi:hypothetical protein